MIVHSIAALLAAPEIEIVFVVLTPGDEHFRALEIERYGWGDRVAPLYCGGKSRRDSVLNGLVAAASTVDADDWVLVHDAARPCLGATELRRLIGTVSSSSSEAGGVLAVPVADTLKRADDPTGAIAHIIGTEPRAGMWQAQTPQMFRHGLLVDALRGSPDATDEASAVERMGLRPALIEGSTRNIKVTFGPDLELAGLILQLQARQTQAR
jgi:2-C-methyl-D-erythritol 4-phosphate cytidylyltransferase